MKTRQRRTEGRPRRHDGSHGGQRSSLRADRGTSSACPTTSIILSAKVSGVQDLVDVYRNLAARCDYPLHLGLTEAGMGAKGIVGTHRWACRASSGRNRRHHSRFSHPAPNGNRTEEVTVAQQILQSLGIRSFTPQVTACPGCGRTTSTFFQEMAEQIQTYLRDNMPIWKETIPGC